MENLLPHSRVLAHLARYSLQPTAEAQRRFFVIVDELTLGQSHANVLRIASAFGCSGSIVIGTRFPTEEQKDDMVYPAEDYAQAKRIASTVLMSDVVGVFTRPVRGVVSLSLGHPKAFSRSTAFVFLGENSAPELVSLCDSFIHVSSGAPHQIGGESLSTDACASIALHCFVEMRADRLSPTSSPMRMFDESKRLSVSSSANDDPLSTVAI